MTRRADVVRLNLEMPAQTKESIAALEDRIQAGSMAEVIRRALALLDVVSAAQEAGLRLYIHEKDGYQREVIFIL